MSGIVVPINERSRNQLRAGAGRADVTPPKPIAMAGFASRKGLSRGVLRPLHVRALLLQQGVTRVAIVSADLISWGVEQAPRLRRQISEQFNVPEPAVVLAATHSHSGPQTSLWMAPSVGVADPDYLALLEKRAIEALEQAQANLQPAHVRRTTGRHDLGVNRRRELDGPPPIDDQEGPRDPTLTAVELSTPRGTSLAVLLHTTCHPVINAGMQLTDEYPGAASRTIENARSSVALFLQGCCGDIDPRGVDRAGPEQAERQGRALGEAALRVLDDDHAGDLQPGRLAATAKRIELPFRELPTPRAVARAAAAHGVLGEWGRAFLDHPDRLVPHSTMELQRIRLARGLELLTINAEASVEYGLHVRTHWPGTIPVAYANGIVGYTPTARQLQAGGYEADASALYYLLPGRYHPDIEATIKDAIAELMEISSGPTTHPNGDV